MAVLALGAGLAITDSLVVHSGLLLGGGDAVALAATVVFAAKRWPWRTPRR